MPSMLDAREARPLTSREIAKVISGILNGVATHDPAAAIHFRDAMSFLVDFGLIMTGELDKIEPVGGERAQRLANLGVVPGKGYPANWMTALVATIGCFHGWCDAAAVDEAVAWTRDNLATVVKLPS